MLSSSPLETKGATQVRSSPDATYVNGLPLTDITLRTNHERSDQLLTERNIIRWYDMGIALIFLFMEKEPHSGGDPEALGRCTECGDIYPVQGVTERTVRPIGTGGTCACGKGEFEPLSER